MRYDSYHWRRGTPESPGSYLVFDRQRGTIEWAVVTDVRPLAWRSNRETTGRTWRYSAYLGPLRRHRSAG